jgi:hypothetical protein
MITDRNLTRKYQLVVRGHVQRDEQQLDRISHRPRASSGLPSCRVVGVWVGFLRGRLHKCGLIARLLCGGDKRSLCYCGWLTVGWLAMIADDAAVACMLSGCMSNDCIQPRQYQLVVRGHVQRDKQQLDHISLRPRASSGFPSCSVVGVWVGFLRGRLYVRC